MARCHDCTAEDDTAKHPEDSEQSDEDTDEQSDEDTDDVKGKLRVKTPDGWQPLSSM